MNLLTRIKEIDFDRFNLNEEGYRAVDDALLELDIRTGNLDGVKQYISKYNTFTYRTAVTALRSSELVHNEEFEYLIAEGQDLRLKSSLYDDILFLINSPFELKSIAPFEALRKAKETEGFINKWEHFDQIIMLFVIALEEGNVPLYIEEYLTSYYDCQYDDSNIVSNAEEMNQMEIVKYLLAQGATIDEYLDTENSKSKEVYEESVQAVIALKLNEPLHPFVDNAPNFEQIKNWLVEYDTIYLVETDVFSRKYSLTEINGDRDIYDLIHRNIDNRGQTFSFMKKIDQVILEGFNFKESTSLETHKFILNFGVLYLSSPRNREAILSAALNINRVSHYISFPTSPESREMTEGDVWAQVFEDQKEYNENH